MSHLKLIFNKSQRKMMLSVEIMLHVQGSLSRAQAFPIAGPLFVSPVKVIVSTSQLIVGAVASIFLGTLTLLTYNDRLAYRTWEALEHTGMGFIELVYSIVNFITLGFIAYNIEKTTLKFKEVKPIQVA
jgi:hypothetical protein